MVGEPSAGHCAVRMLFASLPGRTLATATLFLGLANFLPTTFDAFDDHIRLHLCRWGFGMLLWLLALSMPLAARIIDRIATQRDPDYLSEA